MTEFTETVVDLIRKIPRGKVATYGQLAGLAGRPGAARGVVWILHSSSKASALPWHRVLNVRGEIPFPKGSGLHRTQRRRLESENVAFLKPGLVNLKKCQWRRRPSAPKTNAPRLFLKGKP